MNNYKLHGAPWGDCKDHGGLWCGPDYSKDRSGPGISPSVKS
jgi:hypothetical protein